MRERDNASLARKLGCAKATFSTRAHHAAYSKQPKHCHATVLRERERRRTLRENEKLQKALEGVYATKQGANAYERAASQLALAVRSSSSAVGCWGKWSRESAYSRETVVYERLSSVSSSFFSLLESRT